MLLHKIIFVLSITNIVAVTKVFLLGRNEMSYILPNFKVTLLLQTDLENLNIVLDNSNYSFNFLGNI